MYPFVCSLNFKKSLQQFKHKMTDHQQSSETEKVKINKMLEETERLKYRIGILERTLAEYGKENN